MSLVNDLKTFELMGFVLITKHGAITADSFFAGVAIVVQGCIMQLTYFLFRSKYSIVFRLKGVNGSCHLLYKSTVHKLINAQIRATMRARLSLLHKPFLNVS